MAPYFEVRSGYSPTYRDGRQFPSPIEDESLLIEERVNLVPRPLRGSRLNEQVTIQIISDDKAKVLVKSFDCCHKPSLVKANDKGESVVWAGAAYNPCGKDHGINSGPLTRKKRQHTFLVEKTTVFTSDSPFRVEWRPYDEY